MISQMLILMLLKIRKKKIKFNSFQKLIKIQIIKIINVENRLKSNYMIILLKLMRSIAKKELILMRI
jgi:hypothetical protein